MTAGRRYRVPQNTVYENSYGPSSVPEKQSWVRSNPRLLVVGWGILMVLALYLIKLWQLQFLEGGSWEAQALQQQSKLITLSPPRGVIFDRYGEILVRNIPAYNVTITPGLLPDDEETEEEAERRRAVLVRLSQLLGDDIPYSSVEVLEKPDYQNEILSVGRVHFPPYGEAPSPGLLEMVEEVRWLEPYEPIVVDQSVERDLALLIAQEGGLTMPGVGVEIIPRRSYVYGPLQSQILGFLAAIPDYAVEEYETRGYIAGVDQIGYAGIEAQVEENLRGTPGRKIITKDVLGQELNVLSETPPHPGDNIYLTIDTPLQQVAEEALLAGLEQANSERGVVIALDPRDGQVLAMVSWPTYDNNIFNKKIDLDELNALYENPHHPFLNHAIADQIPPGSTYKIIPATAALAEGTVNRFTTVNCGGIMYLPNRFFPDDAELAQPFYCWINLQNGGGHGPMDVVHALMHSCDVYFYHIGGGFRDSDVEGLGVERLAEYSRLFGLGETTGIDIPGEYGGLVPDPKWKRDYYQETWTTGDTYIMAIGQSFLQVTPLQIANAYAVVANGGTLYKPKLIHHIDDAEGNMIQPFRPEIIHQLDVPESVWQIVREGLDLAVSPEGTGWRSELTDLGINVAGKTGTAEYCDDIAYKAGRCDVAKGETLPTHAWFTAYAPFEAPEIVVLAWIYDGGEGSVEAAPVVHDVIDFYFRRSLGLPLEGDIPTEGELPVEGENPN